MNGAAYERKDASVSSALVKELAEKGRLLVVPVGASMIPMLRQGMDSVLLTRIEKPLRRLDVALYRREDGMYILHRVMQSKGGSLIFCGDGMIDDDPPVTESSAVAVLSGFYRGERFISVESKAYRLYAHLWCFMKLPRIIGLFLIRLRWRARAFIRGKRGK
jgi:signal peptidase